MQFAKHPTWIEPLADGHAGTLRTLEVMRWLARKDSRSASVRKETTKLREQRPDLDPVVALFLFARDQIRYVSDEEFTWLLFRYLDIEPFRETSSLEVVAGFEHVLALRAGDCDDKTTFLATALLSIGIPVRFVVQSYQGITWDHVYLEFYDWQAWGWTPLDPTADGHTGLIAEPGWRQPLPPRGREMTYEV